MNIEGAWAQIIGYMDGFEGRQADSRIVRSEFRRTYLKGYARGRGDVARGDDVSIPDWVNRGGETNDHEA